MWPLRPPPGCGAARWGIAAEVAGAEDLETRTGPAARLFGELEQDAIEPHGVIAADRAGLFVTEDLGDDRGVGRDEGRRRVGGRAAELRIEGWDEVVAQVAIRGRPAADPRHPQFVDEPICRVRFTRSLRPRAGGK